MLPLRAIYHSNRLSECIPMRASLTLAKACLVSHPSFKSTHSSTTVSHILFDLSQQVDSHEVLLNLIRPLAVEISFILYVPEHFLLLECWLLRATDIPPLPAIYHSNCLSEWIPMRVSLTLADTCLVSHPSFKSTDSYRHATTVSHTLFNSSQRVDSHEVLLDLIQLQAVELPSILYLPRHFLLPEY